jgi:hypothetical protein
VLKYIRRKGMGRKGMVRFPLCRKLLFKIGVFPIIDNYYEPLFDYRDKKHHFNNERNLPGIDWNERAQLSFLSVLIYADELKSIPLEKLQF